MEVESGSEPLSNFEPPRDLQQLHKSVPASFPPVWSDKGKGKERTSEYHILASYPLPQLTRTAASNNEEEAMDIAATISLSQNPRPDRTRGPSTSKNDLPFVPLTPTWGMSSVSEKGLEDNGWCRWGDLMADPPSRGTLAQRIESLSEISKRLTIAEQMSAWIPTSTVLFQNDESVLVPLCWTKFQIRRRQKRLPLLPPYLEDSPPKTGRCKTASPIHHLGTPP